MYRLQETDLSLAAMARRLEEIADLLIEPEELQAARKTVVSTEEQAQRWRTILRDRELEVKGLAAKIKASEDRVYGGLVRNPKELKGLQDELKSLRRRRVTKEDSVLEAMVELEQLGEDLSAQQTVSADLDAEWQSEQAALLTERSDLESRRSALLVVREKQAAAPGLDIALYENLRRRRAGRPVALLEDGVCRACGMSLPTGEVQQAKYSREICRCSSCGRVLWSG
jgi:predicted  nucleic acid-binding Zn-ribbon protein